MLEYLAYRKYKKHKSEKEANELAKQDAEENKRTRLSRSSSSSHEFGGSDTPQPILDQDEERWLESILAVSDDEGSRPPLPMRASETGLDSDSSLSRHHRRRPHRSHTGASVATSSTATVTPSSPTTTKARTATLEKGKEKEKRSSHNPISLLLNRGKDKDKDKQLVAHPRRDPAPVVDPDEAEREREDLNKVLDDLDLNATRGNKAFSFSPDNNELVRKFTLVLKDLVNGVPTAIDDLRNLIEDRDGTLKRNYEKLPGGLKKLVAQLPDKFHKDVAPEMLAVAAESQGKKADRGGNIKDSAKSLFMPKSLNDLVTKPSAIIAMLKAIVNFLKLRWPAFIGLNVVWSVAIFLLMLVLWYCHKRGREVRLEREQSQQSVDGSGRVEELADDPMLPSPPSRASSYRSHRSSHVSRSSSRYGRDSPRRPASPPLESPRRRKTHR